MELYILQLLSFYGGYMIIFKNYRTNTHPLYNSCTLITNNCIGLCVIQQRFNNAMKLSWWGPIDQELQDEIKHSKYFDRIFLDLADCKDENGNYPTIEVRKLMWQLKLKPKKKEFWETRFL